MYSDVFCRIYNELGWNSYPEAFGAQLLEWLAARQLTPRASLDLACGTGILCQLMHRQGIAARGMDLSPGMIAIARENCPDIRYDEADMVSYRPDGQFDLVTCTGDALNHILELPQVEAVFRNIYSCLTADGWLVFDLLKETEVSSSEPFEMDFDARTHVWFQMQRPSGDEIRLHVRVYENGVLQLEETITEMLHSPAVICNMLHQAGFRDVSCTDRLLPSHRSSTTWYITAKK